MSNFSSVKITGADGSSNGLIFNAGSPQVCSQPYLQAMAEGDITGHTPWVKIGYTPTMTNADSDIWSGAGAYVYPVAQQQMEFLSSNNADDIAAVLRTGTSTGGTTTSLIDAGANFTAATAVAAGDCVLLTGTDAFGFVTGVSATELTIAGGFSDGLTASGKAYSVVDYSNTAGAHVVRLEYLDAAYAQQAEFLILNGTTVTTTTSSNIFRIQSMRVVAAGSNGKPTGNITLRNLADTPVYGYITAGFTRARNSVWTVPAGKTLYIYGVNVAFGHTQNNNQYCRIYTRATQYSPASAGAASFRTPGIFYPFSEIICSNSSSVINLDSPTKLGEKVDLKVSGIATAAGVATCALRGWLE